jgi:hypothetical protein
VDGICLFKQISTDLVGKAVQSSLSGTHYLQLIALRALLPLRGILGSLKGRWAIKPGKGGPRQAEACIGRLMWAD